MKHIATKTITYETIVDDQGDSTIDPYELVEKIPLENWDIINIEEDIEEDLDDDVPLSGYKEFSQKADRETQMGRYIDAGPQAWDDLLDLEGPEDDGA